MMEEPHAMQFNSPLNVPPRLHPILGEALLTLSAAYYGPSNSIQILDENDEISIQKYLDGN